MICSLTQMPKMTPKASISTSFCNFWTILLNNYALASFQATPAFTILEHILFSSKMYRSKKYNEHKKNIDQLSQRF